MILRVKYYFYKLKNKFKKNNSEKDQRFIY